MTRFNQLGKLMVVMGILFVLGAGFAFYKIQEGYDSLQAFSAAQNVVLKYNEQGQLLDRGKPEEAQRIMRLLAEDWGYPVVESELDPNDPLVNTASEYMCQMAVIGYHVLHGNHAVVLTENQEYKGKVYPVGSYEIPVNGRYWTGFDRMHPMDGKVREMAWSGVAHGLIAELGVGTVTASTLQLGLAVAALMAGLGGSLILLGVGLQWASCSVEFAPKARASKPRVFKADGSSALAV